MVTTSCSWQALTALWCFAQQCCMPVWIDSTATTKMDSHLLQSVRSTAMWPLLSSALQGLQADSETCANSQERLRLRLQDEHKLNRRPGTIGYDTRSANLRARQYADSRSLLSSCQNECGTVQQRDHSRDCILLAGRTREESSLVAVENSGRLGNRLLRSSAQRHVRVTGRGPGYRSSCRRLKHLRCGCLARQLYLCVLVVIAQALALVLTNDLQRPTCRNAPARKIEFHINAVRLQKVN